MSLTADLNQAVATVVPDAATLRAVVQGPASGPGSLVTLVSGLQVKTLARVAAEAAGPYVRTDGTSPITGPQTFLGQITTPIVLLNRTDGNPQLYLQADTERFARFGQADGTARWDLGVTATGGGSDLFITSFNNAGTVGTPRLIANRLTGEFGIGVTPAVSGSRLQVGGDVSIMASNPSLWMNLYYDGAVKYAANGVAAWLRSSSHPLEIRVFTGNAGGPGAAATPIVAWNIDENGHLLPGADNGRNIGAPSTGRIKDSYFVNSPTVTSDARQKRWIALLRDQPGLVAVALALMEIIGTYQFLEAIAEKGQQAFDALSTEQQAGTSPEQEGERLARQHVGITVQELVAVFDTFRQTYPDLPTPAELGLYGRDPVMTKVERLVTKHRDVMIDEPFTDVIYEPTGTSFRRREVPGVRRVAKRVAQPVYREDGSPHMVQVGERDTGIVGSNGAPVKEPVMAQEMRDATLQESFTDTVYDWVDQGDYILSHRPIELHFLMLGALNIRRKNLEARVAALEAAAP